MPGQFDFGNDLDVTLGGVGDDVPNLVFRVKPTVDRSIGLCAPGPFSGQFGIGIDFYAPTLVFREVPMQHIHFVKGQQVDGALDKIGLHEVPATIQKQAAVRKPRSIFYPPKGQLLPFGGHGHPAHRGQRMLHSDGG